MSTLASLVTSTSKQWTRALLLAALAMGCGSEAARDSGVLTDAGATSDGSSSGRTSGGASNDGAADAGSSPAEAAPLDDASSQCTTGPAGVTARRAADFLNLLSLQAHASNGTPAYLNATQFVADAQFVGARHVRDAVNTSGAGLDALKALVQAGITLVAQVAPTPGGSANTLVVSDLVAADHSWQSFAPNAVYALESCNEPELDSFTYNGQTTGQGNSWVPVALFTSDYYKAVKGDPALAPLPFFGVSRVGAEPDNAGLQFLVVPTPTPAGVLVPAGTVLGDYFTQHIYPMEIQYLQGGLVGSAQTIDPTAGDQFDTDLHWNAVQTFHAGFSGYPSDTAARAIPKVITEFGYSTTATSPGGAQVDENTQAKDILTGLLNAWTKGYALVSLYETYEGGDGYGIFASPGTPKVAATYLHNFTTALADDAADARTFQPGSLAVATSGLPASASFVLLQTSGCHFKLVLWNNATNWDLGTGAPIGVSATPVTVSFGSSVSYEVYDPTNGTTPIASKTGAASANVSVADYPIVIDIH